MTIDKKHSNFSLLQTHRTLVDSTRGVSGGIFLGSGFAVATGGLGWLGHVADQKLGTDPWLAVGGVFLGFLYGGIEVWKLTRTSSASDKNPDASSSGPAGPAESDRKDATP